MEGRRAEPCVAQRADRAPGEDWLLKIAGVHSITSYPVGPGSEPTFRMHAARKPTRMRPIYETALVGHGDVGAAPPRLAAIGVPGVDPAAEPALRLMAQPQPGQFDRLGAGARIAGLADALLALDAAAAPWTGRQSARKS